MSRKKSKIETIAEYRNFVKKKTVVGKKKGTLSQTDQFAKWGVEAAQAAVKFARSQIKRK